MSPSRLTTADLAALDDAKLAEVLKHNQRSDGSYELPVDDDWTKLSNEERDHLVRRLQTTTTTTTNSRPLDLDKLVTLLQDVSNRDDPPLRARPPARERETESPEDDEQDRYKQLEKKAYDSLVQDGGCPLYPINMLELVSCDPAAHLEILRPFWRNRRFNSTERDDFYPQDVFSRQWLRWKNFRKWQLDNRGIEEVGDDGFLSFVEKMKRDFTAVGWTQRAAEIAANPACLKEPGQTWYYIQRHRTWQRRYQREPKCKTFSEYEEAVKARLARHGFTRLFHLAEDPKQQSKLATWVEYLGFEYWWLDRSVQSVERLTKKHDEAWEELTRTGILKEDETPDFVRTDASSMRTQADKDRTWKAVQDAKIEADKVYQMTQADPNRLSIPKNRRIQMLLRAGNKLLAAREACDFAHRRSDLILDFVIGTRDFITAKEDVVNQTNLVNWVLGNAHAIEAEKNPATILTNSRQKREAPSEGVCSELSVSKRQKSKRSPHPSNDTVVARERRVLRSRTRPSTNINRQLVSHQSNSISAFCPVQTDPVKPVLEQVHWIKAGAEATIAEGTSWKRKKVAFGNVSRIPTTPKRRKSNARTDGNGLDATEKRALVTPNRPSTHRVRKARRTTPDSHMQSSIPEKPAQQVAQGLRRSARLARLRLEEASHSAIRK